MMKAATVGGAALILLLASSNVCYSGSHANALHKYVPLTVREEISNLTLIVDDLLARSEFDALTNLAKEYRKSKEELSDGSWKLHHFYQSFSRFNEEDWKELLSQLAEWSEHEKVDPSPVVATANAHWALGKQARGNDFASTVSREGWAMLRKELAQGFGHLVRGAERSMDCPGFYVILMQIGVDGSLGRERFMAVFEQGVALEPTYVHLYEMKAYYILPRWYGRPGELREFVLSTTDFYPAVSLWVLWQLQYQGVYANVFEEEKIPFREIALRVIRLADTSSLGVGQANMLAYLADTAGDRATVRTSLASVDYRLDPSMWRSQEELDRIVKSINE